MNDWNVNSRNHSEEVEPRWRIVEPQRRWDDATLHRLRGSLYVSQTLALQGALKLRRRLVDNGEPLRALGAMTGGQAVQQVKAGLRAIYVSGWQVAADANGAGHTYPDQSLYPVDSVPGLVRRINRALQRADQIDALEGAISTDWFVPIIADAEAGFGGALNAYELARELIEAGAAAIHLEDQLSSEKKCGHLGGKVLVPRSQMIRSLCAARLAADVLEVPTVIIARTDADAATLLTSDIDGGDREFLTGERTEEGFYVVRAGIDAAISRGLDYAPWADVIWCETAHPSLDEARQFAEAIHQRFPGKVLAYNCSPSFHWNLQLGPAEIASFQRELGAMGYRFQFVTLAGFHSLNESMFQLARGYREQGMTAYAALQEREFAAEPYGYTAVRHQREVGTGYFDLVRDLVSEGRPSTLAYAGSTEEEQFAKRGDDSEKAA
ncbi:MAG: isocitrate lyase [Myxococcota bacterium]